jgi:hypothetical protein
MAGFGEPVSLTSADGITWTTGDVGKLASFASVAWTGKQWVAVDDGGIKTSTDSSSWTPKNTGTGRRLLSVTWTGSLLVAVGNDGIILTSPEDMGSGIAAPHSPSQGGLALRFAPTLLSVTLPPGLGNRGMRAAVYSIAGNKLVEAETSGINGEMRLPIGGLARGRYVLEVRGLGAEFARPFAIVR